MKKEKLGALLLTEEKMDESLERLAELVKETLDSVDTRSGVKLETTVRIVEDGFTSRKTGNVVSCKYLEISMSDGSEENSFTGKLLLSGLGKKDARWLTPTFSICFADGIRKVWKDLSEKEKSIDENVYNEMDIRMTELAEDDEAILANVMLFAYGNLEK